MAYRLTAMLEFESEAQAVDAFNQLSARATNTLVLGLGTSGEHTSFARVDNDDGSFNRMFYVDRFNIVRQGEYVAPPRTYPLWVQPTGAHDSYPVLDAAGLPTRVEHNGRVYLNSAGTVNSWAPGVFGWTDEGPA
jgi:hypothetical protein